MVNRRRFMRDSVALALAAAPAMSVLSEMSAPRMNLYKVVFDERFSASQIFGNETKRLGAKVQGVRGDVTDLLYHDLLLRWRRSPAPFGGMTTFNSMLVLQMMAGGAGMRVIYRAHHRDETGTIEHQVYGPDFVRRRAEELSGSETDWSCAAANIVMTWPAHMATTSRSESNVIDADQKAIGPFALISWIISPVRRVRLVSPAAHSPQEFSA